MPGRTISEALFEQFCATAGLLLYRIVDVPSPSSPKAADYILIPEHGDVIAVEVKQINPGPQEKSAFSDIGNPDMPSVRLYPGGRVRPMIEDAYPQLKNTAKGRMPAILVAYDNSGSPFGRLEGYEVKVAMFGVEQVLLATPKDPSKHPFLAAHRFGPKRKVSPSHNTTLSAIAVLSGEDPNSLTLRVFHNHHAPLSIRPDTLRHAAIRHFALRKRDQEGEFSEWEEL